MRNLSRFIGMFFLLMAAGACTFGANVEATPTPTPAPAPSAPGREAFMELNADTAPWWVPAVESFTAAQAVGEPWTADPQQIVPRLVGYDAGAPPELQPVIQEVERTDTRAVYLVTNENMQDDSIRAQQLRIELTFDGAAWRVEWAGGRWQCQPGRGQEDWAPALCV